MVVTVFGIVMDVNDEHLPNANQPMEVTLSGILTEVIAEQYSNA